MLEKIYNYRVVSVHTQSLCLDCRLCWPRHILPSILLFGKKKNCVLISPLAYSPCFYPFHCHVETKFLSVKYSIIQCFVLCSFE